MTTSDQHTWGARVIAERGVRFRIWAPAHRKLSVAIQGESQQLAMNPLASGWFHLTTDRAHAGSRYQYVLPDGRRLPDPASLFQPDDVHGMSEVIDTNTYAWKDTQWAGRPWHEAVVYELHVGTFTPAGTFAGVREKRGRLRGLGGAAGGGGPGARGPGRRGGGDGGGYP